MPQLCSTFIPFSCFFRIRFPVHPFFKALGKKMAGHRDITLGSIFKPFACLDRINRPSPPELIKKPQGKRGKWIIFFNRKMTEFFTGFIILSFVEKFLGGFKIVLDIFSGMTWERKKKPTASKMIISLVSRKSLDVIMSCPQTTLQFRQKSSLPELECCLNFLKTLSAVNIRQYEKAVTALESFEQTIFMGLQVCLTDYGLPLSSRPSALGTGSLWHSGQTRGCAANSTKSLPVSSVPRPANGRQSPTPSLLMQDFMPAWSPWALPPYANISLWPCSGPRPMPWPGQRAVKPAAHAPECGKEH